MSDLNPQDEAVKRALKEGLKEWLDEMFATFGRWSLLGLGAAALAGVVYVALVGQGWHKGP